MKELEELATSEFAMWHDDPGKAGTEGMVFPEYVAIGLVEVDEAEGISWWQLKNTAVANADGRGEFYIEPEDLHPVLQAIAEHAGILKLGQVVSRAIDELVRSRVLILWHTHIGTVSPSREDVAEFPGWLVDYGMVYHVPSDTTTLYNSAGVISNNDQPASALATTKE